MTLLVKSKRHHRLRFPKDCEPGLPYTEIIDEKGFRKDNCPKDLDEIISLPTFERNPSPYSEWLLHNRNLRIIINTFMPFISSKVLNLPSLYSNGSSKEIDTINELDTLIIGGGSAGLGALSETENSLLVTMESPGDVIYDYPEVPGIDFDQFLTTIKNTIKEKGNRIIQGKYLGKFEEGILLETKDKFLLIKKINKIIFTAGARYIPPIIEGNDLPGIISRNLFNKLIYNYEKKLDKVIIIGGSNDALKSALLSSKKGIKTKVIYKKGFELFSKFYKEKAEEEGIEMIPITSAKLIGKTHVEGIEYNGFFEQAKLVVYSIIKQPRLEIPANYDDDYVFLDKVDIYVPKHDIYGRYSENIYIEGGLRGISDHYTSYLTGKLAADKIEYLDEINDRIKSEEPYLLELYSNYKNSTYYNMPTDSPYLYSEGGYICECEDVTYNDVASAIKLGYKTVEEIKRVSGICTGECQGKYCAYLVGSLIKSKRLITFRSPLIPTVI